MNPIQKRIKQLEDEITQMKNELNIKKIELASHQIDIESTKFVSIEPTKSKPFFLSIRYPGKSIIINIAPSSLWTTSKVERTNPESGNKYWRYRTVIEADPRKHYAYKMGHRMYDPGTSSIDWLALETNEPLLEKDHLYVYDETHVNEASNDQIDIIQIMSLDTRIQEGYDEWKTYAFPSIQFFSKYYKKDIQKGIDGILKDLM